MKSRYAPISGRFSFFAFKIMFYISNRPDYRWFEFELFKIGFWFDILWVYFQIGYDPDYFENRIY